MLTLSTPQSLSPVLSQQSPFHFHLAQICPEEGGFTGEGGVDAGAGREDQLQAVCYTKGTHH